MSDAERMEDLESRIAFQEDTLDKLNDVVSRQELEIERLTRMIKIINSQLKQLDLGGGDEVADEPPPLLMSLLHLLGRVLLRGLVKTTLIGDQWLHGGSRVRYVLETDRWSHRQLLLAQARRAGVQLQPSQILCARHNGQSVLPEQLDEACRLTREDPEYRLTLIPVSVFHGRLPIRETSWLNLLYAESWDQGGRIGRLLQLLVNGRQTLVHIDCPLHLQQLRANTEDSNALCRKATRLLLQHFHSRRQAVVGPDLSHRRTLMSLILRHPQVRRAIAGRAREKRESSLESERYAAAALDGIAADFSPVTARMLYPLFNAVWRRLYNEVDIRGLDSIRALALDHQLVYLPCHRSHMDYLLLSWALYRHGLMLPHIAAGENLDLPLVGAILKRGGAIFMRRSFQDDALYQALYQQYLALMSRHGHALEYFVEGGRSRTGRLLPPRTGLLGMTLDGWRTSPERPVALIPVWIGYDRVVEAENYQRELEGERKRSESLGGLLGALKILRQRFGRATLSIGEPLLLADRFDLKLETRAQARAIGLQIMARINAAATLTESGMLACALLPQPAQRLETERLEALLEALSALACVLPNAPAGIPDRRPRLWIEQARQRGQLEIDGAMTQLAAPQAREMTFYRNNLLHFFVLPGLCLLLVRRSPNPLPQLVTRMLKVLYPYLQAELFLPWDETGFTKVAALLRRRLIERGLLSLDGRHLVAGECDTALALMRSVEPLLLRYYLLFRLLEREGRLPPQSLVERALDLARKLHREFGFDSAEYADRRVLETFLAQLLDRGILVQREELLETAVDIGGLMRQARQLLTPRLINFIDEQLEA
ncbi:SlyX family protein [Marinobacterium aestuariivivens]|uniref:Glycerol-3-phosphate acyltransferase n=1 Tax=Marinobacterium aestuariivivens TaxID=1698799 RepID=A0ABW2A2Q5_9GAMM